MDSRKYPIGPFSAQESYSPADLTRLIETIAASADQYSQLVRPLDPAELMKTYRPGSWTIQQLVHHVADIQFLHFLRLKKALTEPDYTVLTLIDMDAWVTTADVLDHPVSDSLLALEGITRRYVRLAQSLTEPLLAITYYHPIRQRSFTQAQALAMSAWHLQHHLAHIRLALGQ